MKLRYMLISIIICMWGCIQGGTVNWEWDKFVPGINQLVSMNRGDPLDMVTDSLGNIIIAGSTHSSKVIVDDKAIKNQLITKKFQKEIHSHYPSIGFVIKLDKNGKTLWYKSFKGHEELFGVSLAVDKSGHIYFAYNYLVYKQMNYYRKSTSRYKILKLSPSGSILWKKDSPMDRTDKIELNEGNQDVLIYDIASNPDGRLYVTGRKGGHMFLTLYAPNGRQERAISDDFTFSGGMARLCIDGTGFCYLAYFASCEGNEMEGYTYPSYNDGAITVAKFWGDGELIRIKRIQGDFNGYVQIFDGSDYQMNYQKSDITITSDNDGGCLVWGLMLPGKDAKEFWTMPYDTTHPVISFDDYRRIRITRLSEIPYSHKTNGIFASPKSTWRVCMPFRYMYSCDFPQASKQLPPDFPDVQVVQKNDGTHYEVNDIKESKTPTINEINQIYFDKPGSPGLYEGILNYDDKTRYCFKVTKVCFTSETEFIIIGTCSDKNSEQYYPYDKRLEFKPNEQRSLDSTMFIYKGRLTE